MDSALTCCAGGPGLIPAVDKSKNCNILMVFPPYMVVGRKMEPDTRNYMILHLHLVKNTNTSHSIYGQTLYT